MKSESVSCSVYLTLCDPMGCSPPGDGPPLSMGITRQEHWSGLPFPSPGDLPNPGMEPGSPVIAGRVFNTEPPGKYTDRPDLFPKDVVETACLVKRKVTGKRSFAPNAYVTKILLNLASVLEIA